MEEKSEFFRNKIILVTGGAGAIGRNLVKKLNNFPVKKIIILDNLSSSYIWNMPISKKINFIKGDILDDEKLKWVFKQKPDIVYHLAAHFANQNSVDNPETDLMINGMGILKVLQYAHLVDIKRFIYSSSGCGIYGSDSKMPFEEHDISMKLNTPYQVTKMLGELYTNYFYNLYELPIVNARFFNSFGPGEVPGKYRNVIPNFFYWSIKKQSLPITGSGHETRDFTFVGDIVDGLISMAFYDKAIGEAFNLGASREIKILDLANWINEFTGNNKEIVFKERRNWDKKLRLLSNINKAKKILKYKPKIDFKDGLKVTYDWFNNNWKNIENSSEF